MMICGSAASWLHGKLSNCIDCRSIYHVIVLLKTFFKMLENTSVVALSCDSSIVGVHSVTSESFVFPYSGKRNSFHALFCL